MCLFFTMVAVGAAGFAGGVEGAFAVALGGLVALEVFDLAGGHAVGDAGEVLGGERVDLGHHADAGVAGVLDGGGEDGVGDFFGLDHWAGEVGLVVHVVLAVLVERGVDGGRLDERDREGGLVDLFDLDAEGVGEAFDGVLGGDVHAQDRGGGFGDFAADVDQRAALLLEVREGDQRAVDNAPEVGFEEAAAVFIGDLVEAAVDGDAGVVDPGVDAAELAEGCVGDVLDLLAVGDVALDGDGLAAGGLDAVGDVVEGLL